MSTVQKQKMSRKRFAPSFFSRLKKKQTELASGGDYTEMEAESGKLLSTNQDTTRLQKLFHQSCSTLKYGTFIKITLSNDLSLLITKRGAKVSDEELQVAWDGIVSEYCELVQTKRTKGLFEAWRKVIEVKCKIRTVQLSLFVLRIKYSSEVAEGLFLMGYPLIKEIEDNEAYLRQIDMVEIEARNLNTFLEQYEQEYKNLIPTTTEASTNNQRTELDYERDLVELSRFMGYRIDKDVITVQEQAAIMNSFIDYHDKQKQHGKK